MDWNTARTTFLEQLEKSMALLDRIRALAQKAPRDVPTEAAESMERLRPLISRQVRKLKDNRFEVAVLGLEKAGKSTLLNAWLGIEILPAMDERCTYTACEIWSAPTEAEQFYRIDYYSEAELEKQLADLETAAEQLPAGLQERAKLEEDVREIRELYPQILEFVRRERTERRFRDESEVRDDLRQAIAQNRAQARTIRRIMLKTTKLRADRDIVFHDVPGFNSPIELHKNLAYEKLRRCDTILYAKEHHKPDLVDSEVAMLKVADTEDPHVRVAGKIFIALTRIDDSKSAEAFADRVAKAREKWGAVDPSRIIPVCPPARLYELGTGGPRIMGEGGEYQRSLSLIGATDGIDELKNVVNAYIDTDRAEVLARRCRGLAEDTRALCGDVISRLTQAYPGTVRDLEYAVEDAAFSAFVEWWRAAWQKVEEDFARFYTTAILPKADPDSPAGEHEKLDKFQAAFSRLVESFIAALRMDGAAFESRYRTLGLTEEGIIHPQRAHIEIRKALHRRAVDLISGVSDNLARTLEEIIHEIADWIYQRMWRIDAVREDLVGSTKDVHRRLEHGMATLFLRFARPAINLFLAAPRGMRDQYLAAYRADIVMLNEFYTPENEAEEKRRDLARYLRTGGWEWAGESGGEKNDDGDYFQELGASASAGSLQAIRAEIEADLDGLADYMVHSVYHGAGFIAYCRQELDRLRYRFLENDTQWQKYANAAFRRKHPPIMEEPDLNIEADVEFRRFILAELDVVRGMFGELERVMERS